MKNQPTYKFYIPQATYMNKVTLSKEDPTREYDYNSKEEENK